VIFQKVKSLKQAAQNPKIFVHKPPTMRFYLIPVIVYIQVVIIGLQVKQAVKHVGKREAIIQKAFVQLRKFG
jgi:hypothetical protein